MMNFKYCNEVEKEVSLACLYLPVSICPHDSLDIVDPHAQYARWSNLRLLKYVQDSVTCVSKWKFS